MPVEEETQTNPPAPSVLVAEDNPVNRQVISLLFKTLDTPVEFASNGREAVERYTTGRHPLIMMDIHMAEMDGIEATRIIRSNPSFAPQPIIIALTAQSEEPPAFYHSLGFDSFLEKPLKIPILKKALEEYLPQNKPAHASPFPTIKHAPHVSVAFDEGVLEEIGASLGEGSQKILSALIDTYLNHTPTLFASIDQALVKNDLATIHRAAHTLKSSSANMGLVNLSKLSKQLESWLKPRLLITLNPQEMSKIKNRVIDKVGAMQTAFLQARTDLIAYQIKLMVDRGEVGDK